MIHLEHAISQIVIRTCDDSQQCKNYVVGVIAVHKELLKLEGVIEVGIKLNHDLILNTTWFVGPVLLIRLKKRRKSDKYNSKYVYSHIKLFFV